MPFSLFFLGKLRLPAYCGMKICGKRVVSKMTYFPFSGSSFWSQSLSTITFENRRNRVINQESFIGNRQKALHRCRSTARQQPAHFANHHPNKTTFLRWMAHRSAASFRLSSDGARYGWQPKFTQKTGQSFDSHLSTVTRVKFNAQHSSINSTRDQHRFSSSNNKQSQQNTACTRKLSEQLHHQLHKLAKCLPS